MVDDLLAGLEADHVVDRRRRGVAATEQVERLAAREGRGAAGGGRDIADDVAAGVAHRVDRGEDAVDAQAELLPRAQRLCRTGNRHRRSSRRRSRRPEPRIGSRPCPRPASVVSSRYIWPMSSMLPRRRSEKLAMLLAVIAAWRLAGRNGLPLKMVSAVCGTPKAARGSLYWKRWVRPCRYWANTVRLSVSSKSA